MSKMKLFICSYGETRSPAAQRMYGGKYLNGGLNGASRATIHRMCKEADKIFVFEDFHAWYFKKYFPQFVSKITNLKIEDMYSTTYSRQLRNILESKKEIIEI